VQASSSLWTRLPPQTHTDWRPPGGSVGGADEYTPRYHPRVYHGHASEHCTNMADQRYMACVSSPPARDGCCICGQSASARSARGNRWCSPWDHLGCVETISGEECQSGAHPSAPPAASITDAPGKGYIGNVDEEKPRVQESRGELIPWR